MSDVVPTSMQECLKKLEEYKSSAFTRRHIYLILSLETGHSIQSIWTAASKAGLTASGRSLKYAFTEEEEEALATVCMIYARANKSFTIPYFLKVASYFAGKFNCSEFFSRFFCVFFC